jgi:sodium transport system permease protein
MLSSALQGPQSTTNILKLQAIYLIATVGTPALLMAVMLTRDPLGTLKLRRPDWRTMSAGVALAFLLLPVSRELLGNLDWFFPPPPPGMAELLASMGAQDVPWWLPLLAFAVAPAVCEELAFRGFILSGLERARSPWVPIILSSAAFGVVHMIPQQVFNAMLLGIVLALLAIVSRSLWPGLAFHFLFNGSQVALERLGGERLAQLADRTDHWLLTVETTATGEVAGLKFEWPLLLPCVVASSLLIGWLVRSLRDQPSGPAAAAPVVAAPPPLGLGRPAV